MNQRSAASRSHLRSIDDKLSVKSRDAAIRVAGEKRLI